MQLKMILLGALSALTLMACVPATVGSVAFAPFVVKEGVEVLVSEGQTAYIQDSTIALLAGLTDEAADAIVSPFTYEELVEGNSKQAVMDPNRFVLDFRVETPAWGIKLESIVLVRKLTTVRLVGNGKDYRYIDTLNATFSLTPPKGSAGERKPYFFSLKPKEAKFGAGFISFDVRVK